MMKQKSVANSPERLALARHRNFRQLLVRATRKVNHLIFAELVAEGYTDIKLSHNAVFENLDKEGNSASLLAERAGMTKQSMSVILHDLQDKGYVTSDLDPEDGRARIVRFTDRGWRLMIRVFRIIDQIECDFRKELGPEKFEALRTSLEVIHT